MRGRTRSFLLALATLVAVVVVGAPVAAQDQPYPPPPPTPSPQPEARVTCEVTATPDEITVVCTGEGFAAGSSVLFEARYRHERGQASAPLALAAIAAPVAQGVENETYTETVTADSDGDARAEFSLPCDTIGRVQVRFSGQDPEGQAHVANGNFDPPPCSPGNLAFTGTDLLRMLAMALLVSALGAHLVDKVRRSREAIA